MMFTYQILNQEEMLDRCRVLTTTTDMKIEIYEDFMIFTPEVVSKKYSTPMFVVCSHEGNIVGVLKLVKILRYTQNIWLISIIDVHKKYRNMKVATGLYKALNDWVKEDMILVWSDL